MTRHFSDWLQGYMMFTAASESPDSFHFWTGISTIAGALRRRVWIDQHIFQWTPNFYIVLVGPAGVAAKSTSLALGMKLLERLKIPFGPPSMTWQALTSSLAESLIEMTYISDEGLELKLPMSCLTIPVSELGTFLKPDDSSLVDVLIDLWDGRLGTWGHKTKTTGEVLIKNPWLNIVACTTPAWLQEHVPESMIGGGLTSRLIFVYGDKKRRLVPYPRLEMPHADFKTLEDQLFLDLAEIASLGGEYKLTDAAVAWGTRWYTEHHDLSRRPAHLASSRFGGYIARKQTHVHKLAMVLAAARSSKLIIDEKELSDAAALIDSVEPSMLRAFESIGVADESRRMQEMVALVAHHGFLTSAQLWTLCMRNMSLKDFKETLRAAVEGNALKGAHRNGQNGVII